MRIHVALNGQQPYAGRVRTGETPLQAAQRVICTFSGWDAVRLASTRLGVNQGGGETWTIVSKKQRGVWKASETDTLAWWPH
jgi:hypothetical protein